MKDKLSFLVHEKGKFDLRIATIEEIKQLIKIATPYDIKRISSLMKVRKEKDATSMNKPEILENYTGVLGGLCNLPDAK